MNLSPNEIATFLGTITPLASATVSYLASELGSLRSQRSSEEVKRTLLAMEQRLREHLHKDDKQRELKAAFQSRFYYELHLRVDAADGAIYERMVAFLDDEAVRLRLAEVLADLSEPRTRERIADGNEVRKYLLSQVEREVEESFADLTEDQKMGFMESIWRAFFWSVLTDKHSSSSMDAHTQSLWLRLLDSKMDALEITLSEIRLGEETIKRLAARFKKLSYEGIDKETVRCAFIRLANQAGLLEQDLRETLDFNLGNLHGRPRLFEFVEQPVSRLIDKEQEGFEGRRPDAWEASSYRKVLDTIRDRTPVLIVADAGVGKSVFIAKLALDLATCEAGLPSLIPILRRCREYDVSKEGWNWLADRGLLPTVLRASSNELPIELAQALVSSSLP